MADPLVLLDPRPGDSDNILLQKVLRTISSFTGSFLPLAGGTMTGPLLLASGTEALPGLAFASAPATGFTPFGTTGWIFNSAGDGVLVLGGGGSINDPTTGSGISFPGTGPNAGSVFLSAAGAGGIKLTGNTAVGATPNAYDKFRVQNAYTTLPDNSTAGNFVVNLVTGPSGADALQFRSQLNYVTVNGATYSAAEITGGYDNVSNAITNAAKSVTLLKGRVVTVRSSNAGTTGTATGLEAAAFVTGAGSWTGWNNFTAESPTLSSTGTIGTAVGLRIKKQKVTGVTTGYGVYQEDAADTNYFAGAIAIGNTVAAGVGVASTHKVTIVIGGVTYYLLASNV